MGRTRIRTRNAMKIKNKEFIAFFIFFIIGISVGFAFGMHYMANLAADKILSLLNDPETMDKVIHYLIKYKDDPYLVEKIAVSLGTR